MLNLFYYYYSKYPAFSYLFYFSIVIIFNSINAEVIYCTSPNDINLDDYVVTDGLSEHSDKSGLLLYLKNIKNNIRRRVY
jgi:hypothetical protein